MDCFISGLRDGVKYVSITKNFPILMEVIRLARVEENVASIRKSQTTPFNKNNSPHWLQGEVVTHKG